VQSLLDRMRSLFGATFVAAFVAAYGGYCFVAVSRFSREAAEVLPANSHTIMVLSGASIIVAQACYLLLSRDKWFLQNKAVEAIDMHVTTLSRMIIAGDVQPEHYAQAIARWVLAYIHTLNDSWRTVGSKRANTAIGPVPQALRNVMTKEELDDLADEPRSTRPLLCLVRATALTTMATSIDCLSRSSETLLRQALAGLQVALPTSIARPFPNFFSLVWVSSGLWFLALPFSLLPAFSMSGIIVVITTGILVLYTLLTLNATSTWYGSINPFSSVIDRNQHILLVTIAAAQNALDKMAEVAGAHASKLKNHPARLVQEQQQLIASVPDQKPGGDKTVVNVHLRTDDIEKEGKIAAVRTPGGLMKDRGSIALPPPPKFAVQQIAKQVIIQGGNSVTAVNLIVGPQGSEMPGTPPSEPESAEASEVEPSEEEVSESGEATPPPSQKETARALPVETPEPAAKPKQPFKVQNQVYIISSGKAEPVKSVQSTPSTVAASPAPPAPAPAAGTVTPTATSRSLPISTRALPAADTMAFKASPVSQSMPRGAAPNSMIRKGSFADVGPRAATAPRRGARLEEECRTQ